MNQLTTIEQQTALDAPRTAQQVLEHMKLIQDVMRQVMHEGEHFGKVPGCGDKPALFKAGAEKLSVTFRLTPKFIIDQRDLGGAHREFNVTCSIFSASGIFLGEGVGNCSTMETKYRYRKSEQTCPECGKPTIIKGKKEYGGGWLCYGKKGGCGAKFPDGDTAIENQNMGRVEHDNPADYYNTCLKMAKKRAHVDATLTVTGASDMFTQDIEDLPQPAGEPETKTKQPTHAGELTPEKAYDVCRGEYEAAEVDKWTPVKRMEVARQILNTVAPREETKVTPAEPINDKRGEENQAEVEVDPKWFTAVDVKFTDIKAPAKNKQPYRISTDGHGVFKTWDAKIAEQASNTMADGKTAEVWFEEIPSTDTRYPNAEQILKKIKAD